MYLLAAFSSMQTQTGAFKVILCLIFLEASVSSGFWWAKWLKRFSPGAHCEKPTWVRFCFAFQAQMPLPEWLNRIILFQFWEHWSGDRTAKSPCQEGINLYLLAAKHHKPKCSTQDLPSSTCTSDVSSLQKHAKLVSMPLWECTKLGAGTLHSTAWQAGEELSPRCSSRQWLSSWEPNTKCFLLTLPTLSQEWAKLLWEKENNPEVKFDLASDGLENCSLLSQVSG